MKIYLVRHGQAKAETPRPLSERGAAEVRGVARSLAGRFDATRILHSGKPRAEQTAEILREELVPASAIEEVAGLAPNDDPGVWEAKLAQMDAPIALVGHLPFMGRLASLILGPGGEPVPFDTATVVCLERDPAGSWSLCWRVDP